MEKRKIPSEGDCYQNVCLAAKDFPELPARKYGKPVMYVSYTIFLKMMEGITISDDIDWTEVFFEAEGHFIFPHGDLKGYEICYAYNDEMGPDPVSEPDVPYGRDS